MSLLDAEQSARYIDSLVASVQALEADLAATRDKLRQADADLTTVRDVLNGDLKAASDRVLTLELELQQTRDKLRQAEAGRAEANAQLEAISTVLSDEAVSDFEESFPIVRGVLDLQTQLEQAQARIAALEQEFSRTTGLSYEGNDMTTNDLIAAAKAVGMTPGELKEAVDRVCDERLRVLPFRELDRLSIRTGCETETNRKADMELKRRGYMFSPQEQRWVKAQADARGREEER